ncbi:hypothetical protein PIB30_068555 [Stylosanthes scabra]|uniref:Uncharacterized protein n=1 Tax=Stylosanthes scabra TaxID=79078 RepID=A0ABU6QNX2_9FABA|nr:hypothetical protein [Stylosanthes scabra]
MQMKKNPMQKGSEEEDDNIEFVIPALTLDEFFENYEISLDDNGEEYEHNYDDHMPSTKKKKTRGPTQLTHIHNIEANRVIMVLRQTNRTNKKKGSAA